jgi:hypothetical protein
MTEGSSVPAQLEPARDRVRQRSDPQGTARATCRRKTGRYVGDGRTNGDFYASVLTALGLPTTTFGQDKGPVPELVV